MITKEEASVLVKTMARAVREKIRDPLDARIKTLEATNATYDARIAAMNGKLDKALQSISALNKHCEALERKVGSLKHPKE